MTGLWATLRNEIDNDRPMVLLVDSNGDGNTDHFVTVVGYRMGNGADQYGCLDTWSTATVRWETFQAMASGVPWGVATGHTLNLAQINYRPIADAGTYPAPVECACGMPGGTVVTLDGTASSDPDGDPITYSWTGPFTPSPATGPTPTVTLVDGCPGDYDVTLVVSDGTAESTADIATVTVLDTTPPSLAIDFPPPGFALQDGITFEATASDTCELCDVYFSVRTEAGGVIDPALEDMPASFNGLTWECDFDTTDDTLTPDGYYQIVAIAVDCAGNVTVTTVAVSIRNWAVVELLPASQEYRTGRTMPIKFSVRVVESVDPAMPFVYNEYLTIKIYEDGGPLLQESTYGDRSTDYRIDTDGELYITNFKTDKQPKTYRVEVWRDTMLLDDFTFETDKPHGKNK
jgi:hypothetical protein